MFYEQSELRVWLDTKGHNSGFRILLWIINSITVKLQGRVLRARSCANNRSNLFIPKVNATLRVYINLKYIVERINVYMIV